ncbi:hypothetical protein ACILG0_12165 [Pseudomonadota bacterium AL_CKDN230030165-1A_HGKHYDSX7]
MTRTRKCWIAAGLAVALAAAAWVAAPYYYTWRAEKQLRAWLDQNDNALNLKWGSLHAAPWQPMVLRDVTIGWAVQPIVWAESIEIHDFERNDRRLRGDVQINDLQVLETGMQPPHSTNIVGVLTPLRGATLATLAPNQFRARWDYQADQDRFAFSLDLAQPDAFDARVAIQLSQLEVAMAYLRSGEMATQLGQGNAMPWAMTLFGKFGGVRLLGFETSITDRGYMKRQIALQKRYGYLVPPAVDASATLASPDPRRETQFADDIETQRQACAKRTDLGLADVRGACDAVAAFGAGRAPRITLSARNDAGVSLAEMVSAMNNPADIIQRYAPVVSN